jgi:amino acid transporter
MAKAKKFGAFSGVFTPSVLTILGVIMYMRLGWVVGNAGLITALIIIVVSHIISVTTGLSISSVATDKKIKTGGIYYILSRSLGFPMGGAIGIALFIGTALGISLYLVGFAESVLAVDEIRNFLNLEQDINSYRIIASASLLILAVIAFISTSLAIKSQYFILGAIGLSLISIIWGAVSKTEFLPVEFAITPSRNGASIQEIFGVFFPAVTGFTAGVAMSGDLKDPKRNIPGGTLSAIAVGFIVYVGLSVLFAFFVDRELLLNDYNFLLKISMYSPLVLAGIWGATLSSALGGILGGPRILQAISKDKIMPKFLAKGYGASNEPRNALLIIFLIAEGGILIGELNVIAGVVSMFYLASYGFINLAFFLEKWASTDFRPTFKVKGIFGLIGFVASFAVMAQLNILLMFLALIIMFGLFAILNRKQLKSESGDVWQSVWMSVVRRALHSLDKKNLEERNWQPNIILFSGGQGARPHLIEIGKDLVGQYGLLSNFDLHESKNKKYLFPKHLQSHSHESFEGKGIFTRRQTCSDIYSGIETIISTYGFSGIEPNTVIMGWMRQSKNPVRFSQMIKRIYELDVNLLCIDYDKRFGYGNYKTVDIWWRGSGNNGNLALNLMKFLWASDNWSDAKLRLLIGNPVNENAAKIKQHAEEVVSNMRIEAEIKIINNQIEQKPFYELIRTESINTDLIILGMPDIKDGKEEEFVKNTNDLMHKIGTVVLIKASSQFKNLNLGLKYKLQTKEEEQKLNSLISETEDSLKLILPEGPVANEKMSRLNEELTNINNSVIKENFSTYFKLFENLTDHIVFNAQEILQRIDVLAENLDAEIKLTMSLDKFLLKTYSLILKFSEEQLQIQTESLSNSFDMMLSESETVLEKVPEFFWIRFNENDLRFIDGEEKRIRKFKKKMRLRMKNKNSSVEYKVKFKKLVSGYFPIEYYKISQETGKIIGASSIEYILKLRKFIRNVRNSLLLIQNTVDGKKKLSKSLVEKQRKLIVNGMDNLNHLKENLAESVYEVLQTKKTRIINRITADLCVPDANKTITNGTSGKTAMNIKDDVRQISVYISRNQNLIFNAWKVEILLTEFENGLYRTVRDSVNSVESFIRREILSKLLKLKSNLELVRDNLIKSRNKAVDLPEFEFYDKERISKQIRDIFDLKLEKLKYLKDKFPKKIQLLTNEAYNSLTERQFSEAETTDISLSAFIEFTVQTKFNEPIIHFAERFPEELSEIEKTVQNTLRLVSFSLFNTDTKQPANEKADPAEKLKFIEEQLSVLNTAEENAVQSLNSVGQTIHERLNDLSNNLNLYSIVKEAGQIKRFSDKYSKKKKSSGVKKAYTSLIKRKNNMLKGLWYRQSEAVLYKKESEEGALHTSGINQIHNLREELSVSKDILEKLPFYYKQLFLKTDNFSSEFFTGRENELNEFENTVKRYRAGYHGAVYIIGDRFSGKTFFTHYAINKYLPNSPVYKISPSPEGSVSLKNFRTKFAQAFDEKGSYEEKISKAKRGSVIILDEFELWWERSTDGFTVADELIRIINEYGSRYLFVINMNSYAYGILNSVRNFESYALNVIYCGPFKAEQLKEAVLLRHNAGGMKLQYKGTVQEKIKQHDYAEMFSAYFKRTGGNIGLSVFSWLSDIEDTDSGMIIKKTVSNKAVEIDTELSPQIEIILLQFVLHKRLSQKALVSLMNAPETDIHNDILFLLRSGILIESSKSVYEINRFMYLPVIKLLQKGKLI